jgi:hypothetical protein
VLAEQRGAVVPSALRLPEHTATLPLAAWRAKAMRLKLMTASYMATVFFLSVNTFAKMR